MSNHPEEIPELLKPCPFCGHASAEVITTASALTDDFDYSNQDTFAVLCDASRPDGPGGCGASGGFFITEAEAVAAWNRRAHLQAGQQPEPVRKERNE